MRRLVLAITLAAVSCGAQEIPAGPIHPNPNTQNEQTSAAQSVEIIVPAGTTVPVAITQPVWSKTAKTGDSIYAETVFPVAINNQMAIPAGTYVQGQIDALSRPGFFSPHAQFQIHFTQLVFTNGYVARFGNDLNAPSGGATPLPNNLGTDVAPAVSTPYVNVSSASDILLDNGTQIEILLQEPLALEADRIADAIRGSNPAQPTPFKSATLCRPTSGTPGTPGTPDTVIPGSPGTPDTVIPGAPGQPDTVIPGTPATPDTVIPGIPGTPGTLGTSCPAPPIVTSNPKAQNYKESFEISSAATLEGTNLPPGKYQITWTGLESPVQVEVRESGKILATTPARVLFLEANAPADLVGTAPNADGSVALASLRFAGQSFALYFNGN